ncbi:uncharacterized protein M6B38_165320 [Iris pallida]|uniref:DUF7804 domain-containing protein n=1 Tax=Iris pallida TaxID=29817 RepID=A0AAX6EXY7_IRIPA|nr:uncharacterized protein M6B38_165320 [Iris pallida]
MAALKPFVQLKGSSGGELAGRKQQPVRGHVPMQVTPTSSRRRRGPKQSVVASAAVGWPSLYQYPSSSSSSSASSVDNYWRDQQQSAALCSNKKLMDDDNSKVTPEKLDQWIRDSVGEIVSNIGEAPFLVHIFSNGPMLRLEREEALPESWPSIKKRWDRGAPPDGIILVEELKDEDGAEEEEEAEAEAATKTWGLVVQGKGMDCASCYILNTCRVRSTAGFCTHFCLLRAKCFGDPFEMQLRNAWLQ